MAEMVEPDRTIMIVSIIGLVIIWGSFFYHKYVQGGGDAEPGEEERPSPGGEESGSEAAGEGEGQGKEGKKSRRSSRKKGRKKR